MELDPDRPREELILIEAYYAGELSTEEADDLRRRLAADPNLAALANEHEQMIRYGLRPEAEDIAERERLRAALGKLEAELSPVETLTPVKAPRRRFPVWWAAAAVVLLAATVWLLSGPEAESRLARENLVWVGRDAVTLGPDNAASLAEKALDDYDQSKYDLAYPGLVEGVAKGQLDSINLLYAGISAIGAGDPLGARDILTALMETEYYPDYAGEIRYNLALTELELGSVSGAEAHLRASAEAGYAPAGDLLDKLREIEADNR